MTFINPKLVLAIAAASAAALVYHLYVVGSLNSEIADLNTQITSLTTENSDLAIANGKFESLVGMQSRSIDALILANKEASKSAIDAMALAAKKRSGIVKQIESIQSQVPTNDLLKDCESAAVNLRKHAGK